MGVRVLFLDLDGVLNSSKTCLVFGGYPRPGHPTTWQQFDPVAVALMRLFCDVAGAVIVLSSTWRRVVSAQEVGAGLKLPIIDATPILNGGTRGDEIVAWLGARPNVREYAIIDDDVVGFLPHQLPRLVQVNASEGVSYKNYTDLCHLFDVNPWAKPFDSVRAGVVGTVAEAANGV